MSERVGDMTGENENKQNGAVASSETSTEGKKEVRLPQKRFFRQRAHCNPLSDRPMFHPEKPELMDWNPHYPEFFSKDKSDQPTKRVEILDIGCGYGGLLIALAKIYPDKLALGFEIRTKVSKYVQCKIEALRAQHPGEYQNAACIRTNAMKYMLNFFSEGQLSHMFFVFPDPHFKKKKHKWRIVNKDLLNEYAHCMKVGGLAYTLTDVEPLHEWMVTHFKQHPLFEPVSDEELKDDPVNKIIWDSSEEAQKVDRNKGSKFLAVFRRIEVPGITPKLLMDQQPPPKRVRRIEESPSQSEAANKTEAAESPPLGTSPVLKSLSLSNDSVPDGDRE